MTATASISPDSYVSDNGRYEPYDYWLSTCGLYDYYNVSLDLLGNLDGKTLLDCGCGPGNTAIMFARRGARVHAFDIREENVEKARALSAANGVAVEVWQKDFENLDFPDESFDLAFGSCVIHHVAADRAAGELARLLKPGGKAVFIENSARNPLLMLARNRLVGSFGIPKYGDDDEEYPLTGAEIEKLRRAFPGKVEVLFPKLVLFRLIDFYIARRRWAWVTAMLRGLDQGLGSVPWLRSLGYFQIVVFEKAMSPAQTRPEGGEGARAA